MSKYVMALEIILLVDIDTSLLGAYQDDELIRELARRGMEGLITCDDNMVCSGPKC